MTTNRRRERLAALERYRPAIPVAVEFQAPDETAAEFDARLRAIHGDPPRCRIIAFCREPEHGL